VSSALPRTGGAGYYTFGLFLPPWELTGGKGNIKFVLIDVSVEVLKPFIYSKLWSGAMPVYEYECGGCDKVFEVQQRIADGPLTVCPECGGEVRKLISMSSFQLKGSGWYTDGYSGSSNGKCASGSPAAVSKDAAVSSPCQGGGGACCGCPAAAT